ncbi:MAG: macro domain-containing protein [Deltaproteobacteria bacterium]|jgi:O-acetyl-ADP-ribose deacetylase (regulator of RNase III)|nr:macro domain-containing protein [Deltaproteobacteria bacterium]
MPLMIVNEDITAVRMDGIVNAANPDLLPGGGVCGAVFKTAGKLLEKDCRELGGLPAGKSAVTFAYRLPSKYVVHAVGPVWQGGGAGESELLRGAYETAMELADTHDCNSVAFPLISSGIYGYPKGEAFHEAVVALGGYLSRSREIDVYLSIWPEAVRHPYAGDLKGELAEFLRDGSASPALAPRTPPAGAAPAPPLAESLANLLRVKGWEREELARRANLRLSELAGLLEPQDPSPPPKNFILAVALAFGLSALEAQGLLECAGTRLDPASVTDLAAAFFIGKGIHDVYLVSEASYASGGDFLGAVPRIEHGKGPWRPSKPAA